MKVQLSFAKKIVGVTFVWLLSIALAMPYILLQRLYVGKGGAYCIRSETMMTPVQKNVYIVILTIVGWILPIMINAILYGISIHKLKKCSFTNDSNESMKRRIIQNKKVIKTFIIIGTLFCFCVMPYAVFYVTSNILLTYKRKEVDIHLLWVLNYPLLALMSINSCINPLVYARRQSEVKAFLRSVMNKLCCKSNMRQMASTDMSATTSAKQAMKTRKTAIVDGRQKVQCSFQNRAFNEI